MDSRPGFDATGVTGADLIVGGAVAALIDGSGSFAWAAILTLFVGVWLPFLESQALPLAALPVLFAAIGGFAGAWSSRLRRSGEEA